MKVFLVLVIAAILSGCGKEKVESYYKYEVWVGSDAFAYGYCTDNYITGDKFISFRTGGGKNKMVPISGIHAINEGCTLVKYINK